jgi:hypothetical protein
MKLQSSLKFTAVLGLALGGSIVGCGGGSSNEVQSSGGKGGSKNAGGAAGSNTAGTGGKASGGKGGTGEAGSSGGSTGGSGGETPVEQVDLKKGLIGYWPFEDGQGTVVKDMSGKGNDGVAVEGVIAAAPARTDVAWVPGKKGKAMRLDGINDWVRIAKSESIDTPAINGGATLAAWVNLKQFGQTTSNSQFNFFITRQEDGTAFDHFGLAVRDGKPTACVHFYFATAAEVVPVDQWVHLAMTYDGVTEIIYINGVNAASNSIGWGLMPDSTPMVIGAGQNIDTVKEFVDGSIDEVYMFNRDLSAKEVVALMNAGN